MNTKLSKARGALIGSALGDTIGLYTEFLTPKQAIEAYGLGLGKPPTFSLVDPVTILFQDSHRCTHPTKVNFLPKYKPLALPVTGRFEDRAWTDDTDQALLMVLSYLRNGEMVPQDFAERLKSWCQHGLRCLDRLPFGIGSTVGGVVHNKDFLSNPSGTAFAHWDKSGREIAPNGSLMRTTPVGVVCMNKTEEETFEKAISMGAVTHADPRCAISVATVSALVRGLCRGEIKTVNDVDEVLERAWAYMDRTRGDYPLQRGEFEKHAYAKSLESLVLCDRTMGYVYKCLGSALWCLREVIEGRETFKSVIVKLVMQGGDADTNGAVAGALLGAYRGYDALPPEWRDGLKHREWYLEKISALFVVAGFVEGSYDPKKDPDTELDGGTGFLSEIEMKARVEEVMAKIHSAERASRQEKPKKKKWWKFW